MDCYDESLAYLAPGNTAFASLNLCTATQVAGFYAACLAPSATNATCDAYFDNAANAACIDCILPVNQNGNSAGSTPPILLYEDSAGYLYPLVNQAGCDSVAKGLPTCAGPTSDLLLCMTSACADCTTQVDLDACADGAIVPPNICATITIPASCNPVAFGPISPQCDGMNFQERYTNVTNYMCGP